MRVQACKSGLWAVGLLMMGVVMANENELLDAVRDGELGRVQQLITAGVDLQAATEDGSSALLLATHSNRIEIARALIDAGASVNQKNLSQDSPYLLAGASGHNEILQLAIGARRGFEKHQPLRWHRVDPGV